MNKKFWVVLTTLVAFAVCVIGGYHFYEQYKVTTELRSIAERDNLMITEVLNTSSITPNATWAEVFARMDGNREERNEHIRALEVMDDYQQKEIIQNYIKLLKSENEFVRATSLSLRTMFRYIETQNSYRKMKLTVKSAIDQAEAAQKSGDANKLQEQLDISGEALEQVKGEKPDVDESFSQAQEQSREVKRVMSDWLNIEQQYYPTFLPPRDVQSMLKSRMGATDEFLAIKSPFDMDAVH